MPYSRLAREVYGMINPALTSGQLYSVNIPGIDHALACAHPLHKVTADIALRPKASAPV